MIADPRWRRLIAAYWAKRGLPVRFATNDPRSPSTIAEIPGVWPLDPASRATLTPRHPVERWVGSGTLAWRDGEHAEEGQWECRDHRPCPGSESG